MGVGEERVRCLVGVSLIDLGGVSVGSEENLITKRRKKITNEYAHK